MTLRPWIVDEYSTGDMFSVYDADGNYMDDTATVARQIASIPLLLEVAEAARECHEIAGPDGKKASWSDAWLRLCTTVEGLEKTP